MDRREQLLRGLDKTMRGVEIGPFYNPLAPKRDGWRTLVVANSSAEEQRREARLHDAAAVSEAADRIEDVDVIWPGSDLAALTAPHLEEGADFIIASHVLEHLPNPVAFLQQAARMLKPGGVLSLALPDMRLEFDFFRSPTRTAEVLAAFREARTRHTPETGFDHRACIALRDGQAAWERGNAGPVDLAGRLPPAWDYYKAAVEELADPESPYRDAHAWCFTPSSFALLILELGWMELIDFTLEWWEENPGSEFVARLKQGRTEIARPQLHAERQALNHRVVAELASRWVS